MSFHHLLGGSTHPGYGLLRFHFFKENHRKGAKQPLFDSGLFIQLNWLQLLDPDGHVL